LNTLTTIKSCYPDIPPAERGIADYILEKPEEIYKLNIKELAAQANVSLPTVFRFTRRLGFQGFKDFKVALIRDISVGLYLSPDAMDSGSAEGVAHGMFENEIANLRETLANVDYAAMRKTVAAIGKARRVLIFAVSSSVPIAFDFYWKLCLAGFTCFHHTDVYIQKMTARNATSTDVALGVSFSGDTREVVECLKVAQENGARTVCLTSFINSSITQFADIKLFTAPVKSLHQKLDIPSRMAQIAILDVIYMLVLLKGGERMGVNISKTEEELLKSRLPRKKS
jgi:RpiR family transcriptional regulator, carbohydrate utilization regulator